MNWPVWNAKFRTSLKLPLPRSVSLTHFTGAKFLRIWGLFTPDVWKDDGLANLTVYRAGTCIYVDRSLVAPCTCEYADCALSVLTTVVSKPTDLRAILDAGTNSLTSDLL
jgi:D-serine deaminase-like pyridoxal phosphate-dependent protein